MGWYTANNGGNMYVLLKWLNILVCMNVTEHVISPNIINIGMLVGKVMIDPPCGGYLIGEFGQEF